MRGPGVAAGTTTHKLALNTDYFPTLTDLANIRTPNYVDGRSLRRIVKGSATTWRTAILLEGHRHNHRGIRTSTGKKYVEHDNDVEELYDLRVDPYERFNKYDAAAPPKRLVSRLRALKGCSGDGCRSAENGR